jgi:acyl-CoA thioesterase
MTLLRSGSTTTEFDQTTALTPIDGHPGGFTVQLDPGWSSLVGIHGGYLCAIAVRGAESLASDRLVRTVTTSFLHPGRPGQATLSVRELRRGRSLTTMIADLAQAGQVLTTSRLTLLTERAGVEWRPSSPDGLPPPERCVPIDPPWPVAHFDRADGVLDPASLPFSGGDHAMVRGYLRPLEHRPVDAAWLAMASDWFPPPSFVRLAPPPGGVSIDLTTHIHRAGITLGEDGWLTGAFEVQDSSGGLAVEHGRIAQRDGTLVAESFQTRLTARD